jgi:hypothetical protein
MTVAMLAAAGAAPPASAQVAQVMSRNFEVRSVDTRVVETWIWDLCEEHAEEECQVIAVSPGNPSQLSVRGTPAVIARVARLLAERDSYIEPTQTFQILLVEARRGGGMDPALPRNAAEALADVKQFLPFDSFRLLDTALLSTTREGVTALSGPAGLRYQAALRFRRIEAVDGPVIMISTLRVSGFVEREQPAGAQGEPAERGLVEETVIETSLSVGVGETAVVGTSRLNGGDEALILLLTAISPS